MFTGYLQLGGLEIANSDRLLAYSSTSDCAASWWKLTGCGTLAAALADDPYEFGDLAASPWFDETRQELSARFLGVAIVDIQGRHDSTRRMSITQSIGDGGVLADKRHATKEFRITAAVLAVGEDALSFGLDWLNARLEPGSCGQHGNACGLADLTFFETCPPEMVFKPDPADPSVLIPDREAYKPLLDTVTRFMHDVAVTSGATVREYLQTDTNPGTTKGAIVEFTITSERGFIYGAPVPVSLIASSDVFEDVQRNIFLNPTTDTAGTTVMLRTNLVPNPSLETAVTGWLFNGRLTPTLTSVGVTGGRVSGELSASGPWSIKALTTQNATSDTEAFLTWEQTIPCNGRQVILGIWGAVADPNNTVTRLRAEYRLNSGTWLPLAESTNVPGNKSGRSYQSSAPITLPAAATAVVGIRFLATGRNVFTAYADSAMVLEG